MFLKAAPHPDDLKRGPGRAPVATEGNQKYKKQYVRLFRLFLLSFDNFGGIAFFFVVILSTLSVSLDITGLDLNTFQHQQHARY